MIYKLMLLYNSTFYECRYNITPIADVTKSMKSSVLKQYQNVCTIFQGFRIQREISDILYIMLRDGWYVGFMYNSEENGSFLMPLDLQYCRIYGKGPEGHWIVYFNAAYFDQGTNVDFVVNGDDEGVGLWDQCFIDGYNAYKTQGRDYQWFMLTPELTACFLANTGDEFYMPLPFYLPLFKSLLQLLDTENLIAAKNELQNYKLILNKIPFMKGTEEVDDFAVSEEVLNYYQEMEQAAVPNNVGVGTTPCDVQVISFDKSTSTADTDELGHALNNLFSNAGVNQLVVGSGSSSNANGLKFSLANDLGKISIYIRDIESWLNFYIKKNISENFKIEIFDQTRYNQDDYIGRMKQAATLGGSKLDYMISLGNTPLRAVNKLRFENQVLNIQDYMEPLQTSYTTPGGSNNEGGAPTKSDGDLTEEGQKTRDSGKNDDKGNK